MATLVVGSALHIRVLLHGVRVRSGSTRSLLLRQDLVVLRVDAVGFALVDNAPFVEQVVAVLEGYHFLLFVGVHRLTRAMAVVLGVDTCIADHVVREVDHRPDLGWLLMTSLFLHA